MEYNLNCILYQTLNSCMKIPKKIDHCLTDAIVNIQFNNIPSDEEFLAFFLNIFKNDIIEAKTVNNSEDDYYYTVDKKFKIAVTNNSITFNFAGDYEGWENYRGVIQKFVLPFFSHFGDTLNILRLGVRYISSFPRISIFNIINGQISLNFINEDTDCHFQTHSKIDNHHAIVNLVYKNSPVDTQKISLVDIDIININDNSNSVINFDTLITNIDKAHDVEKELFFSTLSDKFLRTLNPQY